MPLGSFRLHYNGHFLTDIHQELTELTIREGSVIYIKYQTMLGSHPPALEYIETYNYNPRPDDYLLFKFDPKKSRLKGFELPSQTQIVFSIDSLD